MPVKEVGCGVGEKLDIGGGKLTGDGISVGKLYAWISIIKPVHRNASRQDFLNMNIIVHL